jgi:NADPH2:quinone reductase
MKAICVEEFGEPDVLRLVELPDLEVSAGQILVRLQAIGVNPVETYIRAGAYANKPALPYTPGNDGAGEVARLGEGVDSVQPGDRVFLSGSLTGTYAGFALCAPHHVHPLGANATFAEGAALGVPYATAYRALFHRGNVQSGETVLIHGASGGVGSAAVQLARAEGLRVFGTAGSVAGLELVRELGADRVFNHKDLVYRQAILDATDGRGVDCILEMLANINLGEDLRLLGQRGRVVVIGSRGPVEINPRETTMRDADIRGMMLGNTPAADLSAIYLRLGEDLAEGRIRPVIDREFPLVSAPDAHRAVMAPEARGKIVLVP